MSNPLNGTANGFAKTISVLTSVATVLSLSGAAYLAPLAASAAVPSDYGLTEGNTISASGTNDPDVYIVNALGYKRLFLNPIIFSFYGHLGGFANVKSVSAAARDAFPTSGLFRNCETNDQAVWAVEVNGEDTAVFHHVAMSGDAAVAQDANFFKKVFCINNNEAAWYPKSSVNYTSLSQVPVYSRVPGSTPTPTPVVGAGSIVASLSPDNPAAGTVISTQGVADLAHFRLTNTGGTAMAVNSLKFQRLGISGDSTYSNIYIYSLSPFARLTDAVTPSTGVVNITGGTSTSTIITVPANSYVDISIRSDIAASTSGQTVGFGLIALNGTVLTGLNGNLFQVAANPSDMATAVLAATSGVLPATGTTDPLKDTVVWQNTITISNKNVYLKSFALRQTNSINNADVNNFRLFVDGTQIAQVQNLDSNGYATFNPATQATLLTGSRTIKVLADITGGTSRKLTMSLRASADAQLVDSNYGENVAATITSSGTFPQDAGTLTINSGSIVVQKDTTSPSGNIVKGTSDAVLGRYTLTAYGEPTKISTLIAGVALTAGSGAGFVSGTSALRNGRIMVYPVGHPESAQQYGSTTTLLYSTTASRSYTTNLVVNPGTPLTAEVRADIYDSGDTSDLTQATTTIQSTLFTGSSNGQGMVSLTTSAVPSAKVAANTLTVAAGSMTISQNASLPSQSIVVPATNAKIGSFVIAGNTSESINVNTLTLDVAVSGNGAIGDLSNVYLKWNGIPTSIKSSISLTGNTFSVSQVLPVNGNILVEVYADLANVAATTTYISKVAVSGTTTNSAQTVNTIANGTSATSAAVVFVGQTMSIGSSLFASAVAASNPAAKIVAANQTVDIAKFTFTSTVGNSQISELQFKTVASSSQAGISSVVLKKPDGTTLSGQLSTSGASQIVTFGSLSGLTVPANSSDGLTVTVAVTTGGVGVNMASSALNVGLVLNYVKSTGPDGVLATDNTDRAGNAVYLHAAYPIVAAVALPSTVLTTGVQTVSKFTVAASNGSVGLGRFYWTINKDTTSNVSSTSWQLLEDGIDISSFGQWASLSVGVNNSSGKIQWTASSSAPFSGALERLVSTTPKTYELRVNITAIGTTGNYQTVLTRATGVTSPTTAVAFTTAHGASLAGPALVWSDRSSLTHTQATADWMNDYLLATFPISQGLVK